MADSELKHQGPSGQKRLTNPDGDGYVALAEAIVFDNAGTDLTAEQVQEALAELAARAALPGGTAAGQTLVWSGSAWQTIGIATGTALTDADQSIDAADGSRRVSVVPLTGNRTKTLLAGDEHDGLVIERYDTAAFTMAIEDDASSTVIYTFPADGVKRSVSFRFDGTNWEVGVMLRLVGP